jgi:SPP1 gp7 family putative phage head morphogenesis protein
MPAEKVSANQALFNASVRHQIHVLRFSEQQAKAAIEALKKAEGEILERITGAMAKGLETNRLEALLTSIRQRRAQVFAQASAEMEAQLKTFAEMEADWEIGALKGASPVELNTARVPLEQLHATVTAPISGIPLKGWMDNIAASEATAIQAAVTQAVLQGQTIDDLVRKIRGTKAKDYADGILSTSTRNAQALARTAVNHVSNASRNQVWQANQDIVRALRWTSTLDGRTSPICRARDGHLSPIGDKSLYPGDPVLSPAGAQPPAHFNCRSLMVAVLDGVEIAGDRPFIKDKRVRKDREAAFRKEAKERGVPIQQVRKEWADKNVGQVPAATTYQEWLKTQPHEFQNEILGEARAEMFRKGLPLGRFVDKSGRSLTLAELKAELSGDALNVLQPAIGVKAKGLLMQGLEPDDVLAAIKAEFPEASTTAASIASYKSELNKAGLLPTLDSKLVPSALKIPASSVPAQVNILESQLPTGLKNAIQGQWGTVVDSLDGHPGAYAFYKPGVGVQLSAQKLSTLSKAQAQQVMAHELAHLMHKVHDVNIGPISTMGMKETFDGLPKDVKKLYSYYGSSTDELWAEVLGQAIHPSPVTSQGVASGPFVDAMKPFILQAKKLVDEIFPEAPPVLPTGPTMSGIGEVAGKPKSIGGFAKALLQQGMPDDQVLTAVLAEFPKAKTTKASIASYKSQLKKVEKDAIGKPGPTVSAKASPAIDNPKSVSPPPHTSVTSFADPAAEVPKASANVAPLSGLTKTGGKPGGSNPGGLYVDAKGDEWLVKGNLQKANNSQPADVSDARAKNEVLASELMRTLDKGLAPEMRLVDLEGQYGGGLGVMSKMLDEPVVKFNKNNAAHLAAAQEDFALHAWLGNWDVVGASFDNLVMKNGKAVNIDPGGALLFRAQGVPKGEFEFDDLVSEWNSMRKAHKNPNAAAVYGSMTDEQLIASAKRLMVMTDEKIDELVDAFGPGDTVMSNAKFKKTLKLRRDDILQNVGLKMPKATKTAPPPVPNPTTPLHTPGLEALQGAHKTTLDDLVLAQANNPGGIISDAYIAKQLNKHMGVLDDDDFMVSTDDIIEYKAWKKSLGAKVHMEATSSADPEFLKAKKAAEKAAKDQVKSYKKMTAEQLVEALVPPGLEVKPWWGKTKKSWTIQQAAIPLFKAGLKTATVKEALDLKFGASDVPKVNSLASMKSKLKKEGLLEGPIGTTPVAPGMAPGSMPEPKLWKTSLGSKSSTVKNDAKNLISQGQSAKQVTDWIQTQFSTPSPKGAADLYELALYEVKTGKAQKAGVAGVSNSHYSNNLPAPVPLRPASRIGDAGPPPPRFTPEGHQAALKKYGGSHFLSASDKIEAINKKQRAARLEELTPEEYAAIKAYTGAAYREVNRKLRDGLFAEDVYLQAWTDAAMQGLWKLPPWSGEVVRGITVGSAEVTKLKKFYRVGATVVEDSFLSTSNAAKGSGFGGNVRYRIKTRSGRDVKPISSYKGEEEVLLAPGVAYKVTKVEETTAYGAKTLEVWMEEA